jgi:translocation and assembly module TamA
LRAVGLAALAALAGCGASEDPNAITFERPETAIAYEAALEGAPSEAIDSLMRDSLEVFRREEDGAQSLAYLRRRAQGDLPTVRKILRAYGYYEGDASVRLEALGGDAEQPAMRDDAAAASDDETPAKPTTRVVITVAPGPRFTLARHDLVLTQAGERPPPALNAADFGSPVGGPATAAEILAAESAAAAALRRQGRPWANVANRSAVADLEVNTIEIETEIVAGPYAVYGETRIEGVDGVKPEYIDTYRPWEPGEPVDEEALRAYQQALIETDLFDAIAVRPPETPPERAPGEVAVPITIAGTEAPRRSVTAGVRWSTDVGPSARGTYENRNLFGSNETIGAELDVGLEEQRFDLRYREPQFLRPGQDFTAGFNLRHIDDDAFEETAGTLTVGLERQLTDAWTVGAGGLLEVSNTDDRDGEGFELFYLAGLPVFAEHDDTDDTLNPTEGVKASIVAIPFAGYRENGDLPMFTRLDARGSTYFALDEDRNYILAARGRAGVILAEEVSDVPAGKRLYSGGGGSVRGYAERSIGPENDDGDPTGGLSVLELGAEMRARIWGDLGLAGFVEAGAVSDKQYPTFDDGAQLAAGLGVRYYSPVGPIRLDVAVPVNPRDGDESFQFYLAIGQAY